MSVEDKLDQAKGAVKEGFGKLVGDAKGAVEGAIDGVKNIFGKDKE